MEEILGSTSGISRRKMPENMEDKGCLHKEEKSKGHLFHNDNCANDTNYSFDDYIIV